jgi:hypothetical protein
MMEYKDIGCRKEGNKRTPQDAAGRFFKTLSHKRENIEVFQLVEYVPWKHEVAGSSPAFYTV